MGFRPVSFSTLDGVDLQKITDYDFGTRLREGR
jgi:hypothetical protein